MPRPHCESPWGDEKLSDTLTAEAGRKWEMFNFALPLAIRGGGGGGGGGL